MTTNDRMFALADQIAASNSMLSVSVSVVDKAVRVFFDGELRGVARFHTRVPSYFFIHGNKTKMALPTFLTALAIQGVTK